MPLLLALLFSWLLGGREDATTALPMEVTTATTAAGALYAELCLAGEIRESVFEACYRRMQRKGVGGQIIAIADMSQPSDAKRLYLIDLDKKELIMRTYVAHGQGSGERMATTFSNREGSHATSLGLYRVGARITSPKHGPALLLHGLEPGLNCQAEAREVIMHGADYVSELFITENGRLGRSWGCPAVSRTDMPRMVELLANDGILYVHGDL